jgi:hypothetical protein
MNSLQTHRTTTSRCCRCCRCCQSLYHAGRGLSEMGTNLLKESFLVAIATVRSTSAPLLFCSIIESASTMSSRLGLPAPEKDVPSYLRSITSEQHISSISEEVLLFSSCHDNVRRSSNKHSSSNILNTQVSNSHLQMLSDAQVCFLAAVVGIRNSRDT